MLGRLATTRSTALAGMARRRVLLAATAQRSFTPLAAARTSGGLLMVENSPRGARAVLAMQRIRSLTNVPTYRAMSFQRALPNLAMKLLRVPAALGGATIAGLAYLNYKVQGKIYTEFVTSILCWFKTDKPE